MPTTDQELLCRFAKSGDEGAFADFVKRHLNLVYNVTRRRVDNHHLAEEVCQEVFRAVARKALQLSRHPAINAWLFRASVLECLRRNRASARRERRQQMIEQHLSLMNELETVGDNEISEEALRTLDDCVDALKSTDRELILRRFYRRESFKDIGEDLGISENASQKRTVRILRKLERLMTRQGAVLTAAVLASHLSASSSKAAPADLAASVTREALAISMSGSSTFGGVGLWLVAHFKSATIAILAGFSLPIGAAWVSSGASDPEVLAIPSQSLESTPNQNDALATDAFFGDVIDPAERMRRILDLEDKDQRLLEIGFLVRNLKPEDLPAALAVLAEREPEDVNHLGAFLESWAALDAEASLAFVDSRLPAYRERYMKPLMRGWVGANPDGAWRYVSTLEDDQVSEYPMSTLDLWLQEMSLTDPLKGMRLLTSAPDKLQAHHFTQIFANWPDIELGPALSAIDSIDNEDWALLAVNALSQSEKITVDRTFIEELGRVLPTALVDRAKGKLLAKWLVAEPAGAIDYVKGITDPVAREGFTKSMLSPGGVSENHREVFDFIREILPESLDSFVQYRFQSWLIRDGEGAVEVFRTLDSKQQGLTAKYVGAYCAQRTQGSSAYELGLTLTDSESRQSFFSAYVDTLAQSDFPGALAMLERVDDEGIIRKSFPEIAKAYTRVDPEAALPWVMENAPSEKLAEIVGDTVQSWAKRDQPGAVAWFENQSDPGLRDVASAAISKASLDYPETAATWALVIDDPEQRAKALSDVANRWVERDVSAFHDWFHQQPESVRQSLLGNHPKWVGIITN